MGIVSSFFKSAKLRKLQLEIAPRVGTTGMDLYRDFLDVAKTKRKEEALEAYLDLCEGDSNVAFVMERYGLRREDLKQFYVELMLSCGGWFKGHYAPLSSIAYGEPLIFLAETKQTTGWTPGEIGSMLQSYWEGEIRQGCLIEALKGKG
jgi:hypothetical protein